MTAALIIVLAVAIPIGAYAWWQHRYKHDLRDERGPACLAYLGGCVGGGLLAVLVTGAARDETED